MDDMDMMDTVDMKYPSMESIQSTDFPVPSRTSLFWNPFCRE